MYPQKLNMESVHNLEVLSSVNAIAIHFLAAEIIIEL